MLRDTVVSVIAERCGKRTDLTSAIVLEMQVVQETVLEAHHWFPWFLETEMASTVTIPNEERVPLPPDFLGEIEDQSLWIQNDDGVTWDELTKGAYDVLLQKYPGSGKPVAYDVMDEYFVLRYTPDLAYSLKMRYYSRDAVLDSNVENRWLKYAAALVIGEVGKIIAGRYLQNPALEAKFAEDASVAWDTLYRQHVSRENTGRMYSMGDD